MYIISMGGGLGNQMFEYAFYVHLKEKYPNIEIKLDTKYAFPISHNGIELFKIFNLTPHQAEWKEVKRLVRNYPIYNNNNLFNRNITRVLRKVNRLPKTFKIQKDFTAFYEDFLDLSETKSSYFYGAFANYKYFEDIKDNIRKIYKFPYITDTTNLAYKKKIEENYSVSIHIRRGDYIKEGIRLVPEDFYLRAIDYFCKKDDSVRFFVFTDDKEYCKKLFIDRLNFEIIEGNTGENSFRDMQLMSLCRHNIIANSTFSFWGAFLNSHPDKIVIAPNIPFTGCSCRFVCPDWITL